MSRKDSWSKEEDKILVDSVLNHIKAGLPQLKAFEEASERLERTENACGYRWNGVLRHQYKKDMEEAKKEYDARENSNQYSKINKEIESPFHSKMNEAISILEDLRGEAAKTDLQSAHYQAQTKELEDLRKAYDELKRDYNQICKEYAELGSLFKRIANFSERSKELAATQEEKNNLHK